MRGTSTCAFKLELTEVHAALLRGDPLDLVSVLGSLLSISSVFLVDLYTSPVSGPVGESEDNKRAENMYPPPPGQVADHFKVKLTNFACASIMNDPVGVRAVFVGGENNLDALAGCAPELLAGGLYVSCLFALSPPWTVYDPRFHTRTVISLGRRLSCRFLAGVVVWPFVSSSPSHSHCTFAEGLNEVRCCAPHAPVQEIHKCTPNPVHSSFTSHTRSATEKTDVFCFGLTAFEIVTGHKPVNATEALGGSNTELCMF